MKLSNVLKSLMTVTGAVFIATSAHAQEGEVISQSRALAIMQDMAANANVAEGTKTALNAKMAESYADLDKIYKGRVPAEMVQAAAYDSFADAMEKGLMKTLAKGEIERSYKASFATASSVDQVKAINKSFSLTSAATKKNPTCEMAGAIKASLARNASPAVPAVYTGEDAALQASVTEIGRNITVAQHTGLKGLNLTTAVAYPLTAETAAVGEQPVSKVEVAKGEGFMSGLIASATSELTPAELNLPAAAEQNRVVDLMVADSKQADPARADLINNFFRQKLDNNEPNCGCQVFGFCAI